MSISALMRTSASGMDAQANRLGTVADNIANVNTTGYKRSSPEFSSFIPVRSTSDYVSGAVNSNIRNFVDEQGILRATTSVTDVGISGNGFFVVTDPDGSPFLTRAGSFVQNGDGELINAAGFYLMGYPLDQGAPATVANGTAGLERVTISDLALQATPSDEGVFYVNVPSEAAIVPAADLPSANAATATYTAKTSLVTTANLGTEVTIDIFWSKTAANTWELTVYDRADAPATGEFPYASPALVTSTITFDGTTGALAGASRQASPFRFQTAVRLLLTFRNPVSLQRIIPSSMRALTETDQARSIALRSTIRALCMPYMRRVHVCKLTKFHSQMLQAR